MAINPIQILKDLVEGAAHTITITSVESLGSGQYKLNTENTLYLRTLKQVTIAAVDYKVVDFSINSFITVEALSGDVPVVASSFDAPTPLFVWGNPQMVSGEIVKRINGKTIVWPYIWVVEISNTQRNLAPESAVKATPSFNIFFLDSNDKNNWTIEEHYDEDIYPLNNYIDFFTSILKSRRDLFDTDSITYTQINHVNFGDYIVDQGNKEKILNDNVTGIQLQIDIPYTIDTCDDIVVTSKCNPATYKNSDGSFIQSINSEDTFIAPDITVTINTVAQPPSVTNKDLSFTIAIPAAISTSPLSTGQETSFRTGDDGSRFLSGEYASVDVADMTDTFTLLLDNEWGHKHRFTGDTGGYMVFSTGLFFDKDGVATTKALAFPNDILRDYVWRRRWFLIRGGTRNWNDAVDLAQTDVKGGESGWNLPNRAEYESITTRNADANNYFDTRLFIYNINMWSSTTNRTTTNAERITPTTDAWTAAAKTQANGTGYVKVF